MRELNLIRTQKCLDGVVLHILLDRPKANILDAAMISSIVETLNTELTDEMRLVVFEGAGNHFSFGASVEEHQAEQVSAMLTAFHGLFRTLADLAVPTCALVRGQCLGGGMELACWCTWVVATPDARFGQPEIQLAVFPPMASLILPWRAGGQAALDLCMSGRSITADEALRLGIVNAVVDNPEEWWKKLVHTQLSKTSALSLRYAERAVRIQLIQQLDRDIPVLEELYVDELMKTHDANEGVGAFLERRPPKYTNR